MAPTLTDGDFVLAKKFKSGPINGSIAVIQHPDFGNVIKRILYVDEAGKVLISGDNPVSTSPELLGPIDLKHIKFQAFWRISKSGLQRLKLRYFKS